MCYTGFQEIKSIGIPMYCKPLARVNHSKTREMALRQSIENEYDKSHAVTSHVVK